MTFETSPELEFEHYLCVELGGMTLDEMRSRMGNDEFQRWGVYYGRKAQREELAAKQSQARARTKGR